MEQLILKRIDNINSRIHKIVKKIETDDKRVKACIKWINERIIQENIEGLKHNMETIFKEMFADHFPKSVSK